MRLELHTQILLGMVVGVVLGLVFGPSAAVIEPVGQLFLRMIRMIVVPLVFASLVVGTASLGDPKRLGRIGLRTVAYYMATTAIAIVIGLLLANVAQPGSRLGEETKADLLASYSEQAERRVGGLESAPSLVDTLLRMFPTNPVEALASGDMLQIIAFALLLGIALTLVPHERTRKTVVRFFEGVNDAMIQLVHIIMRIAPYGVLALIAAVVGQFGTDLLWSLLVFCLVVIGGLLVHMLVVYPLLVRGLAGMAPADFFRGIRPAQLIAFSTSSSNAALPVTMDCARLNLGVPREITSFVLPLGATVNMDGTALFQGAAAIFIAQVYGIELGLTQQMTVVLMATLASIGAAGVPGVGIITLALVLQQLGLPVAGIGFILGVDRLLGMCRTAVNVGGDASAAVVIAAGEKGMEGGETTSSSVDGIQLQDTPTTAEATGSGA